MAARTPRRSFATPFVVTLAAAPAACYVQSTPGPTQPPPAQPTTQTAQPDQPPPMHPVVNPPRPQTPDTQPTQPTQPPPSQPTTQASTTSWTIFKSGDGCSAAVKTECPKGVMCNPPPPMKYACPDSSTTLPLTIVSEDGGATCHAEVKPVTCPQGAVCNPPRPRAYPCPTR